MSSGHRYVAHGTALFTWVALLLKAVDVAVLGSYLPLLVAAGFGLLLGWGYRRGGRTRRRTWRLWSGSLITWGAIRILLTLPLWFTTSITENHVHLRLSGGEFVLSLLVLGAGILLWRESAPSVA